MSRGHEVGGEGRRDQTGLFGSPDGEGFEGDGSACPRMNVSRQRAPGWWALGSGAPTSEATNDDVQPGAVH